MLLIRDGVKSPLSLLTSCGLGPYASSQWKVGERDREGRNENPHCSWGT